MRKGLKLTVLGVVSVAVSAWLSGQALAQPTCGCLDIALVIDDTGSMGPAIANVKTGLNAIISMAQAASGGDLHMSLVSFPDDIPIVRQALTSNLTDEMTAVNNLSAGFTGGNEPEASDEALRFVVTGATNCAGATGNPGTFRAACTKIAVLVTDARPGGCDDTFTPGVDDVAAAAVASLAATAGVKISAVYVPTNALLSPTIVPIMQNYATTTGGQFLQVGANGSGTANAIMQIIEACGGLGAARAPALSWPLLAVSFLGLAAWGGWRLSRSHR